MLHEHGISVWGSFVFGFDTDDPEVFDRTVEFAIEMKLTMANFAMLTPVPRHGALPPPRAPRGGSPTRSWWLREDHDAGSPLLRAEAHDARAAARGLGARVEPLLLVRSMWQRYVVPPGRAGSSARLLAAQRDAAPRRRPP